MKKLTLIFFLAFFHSVSQTVSSDCNGTLQQRMLYKRTADKLALTQTENSNDTYKDSISINKQFSERFLKALVAVYNATNLPASDTVCKYLPFQAAIPEVNTVLFNEDSTSLWLKNFRNGISPTGNNGFDSLNKEYHFALSSYSVFGHQYYIHMFTLYSDSNYNLKKVLEKYLTVNLGGMAQEIKHPSKWYHIYYDSIGINFIDLKYQMCWNYFSGMGISPVPSYRTWEFRVYTDCKVEYLGSWGNALPSGMINVTEISKQAQPIVIYPNPAKKTLYFNGLDSNEQKANIELLNSQPSNIL